MLTYHAFYVSIITLSPSVGAAEFLRSLPHSDPWKLMTFYRLEKYLSIQLIAVGPVIDLYGKFAVEKLTRPMELYPDRAFSKPEFTALPPYLFSGADLGLLPSRDEPFGLVAVELCTDSGRDPNPTESSSIMARQPRSLVPGCSYMQSRDAAKPCGRQLELCSLSKR